MRHNNQTSPIGFLSLKLTTPACAVLLVLGTHFGLNLSSSARKATACFNKRRPYVVTLRWWLSLTLSLQELPKWWRFTKNLRFNQQKLEVKHIQIEEVENGHDCIWKLGMVFGNWRSETESCSRKLESYIQMYSETACCIRKLVLGNWHSETRARAFGFKNCIQKLGGEVMDSCNWRFQNPRIPC